MIELENIKILSGNSSDTFTVTGIRPLWKLSFKKGIDNFFLLLYYNS